MTIQIILYSILKDETGRHIDTVYRQMLWVHPLQFSLLPHDGSVNSQFTEIVTETFTGRFQSQLQITKMGEILSMSK